MTSLAEQLKQLAAPQTALLLHSKKKASFLFDPKQAAELDKDTFYELGKVYIFNTWHAGDILTS